MQFLLWGQCTLGLSMDIGPEDVGQHLEQQQWQLGCMQQHLLMVRMLRERLQCIPPATPAQRGHCPWLPGETAMRPDSSHQTLLAIRQPAQASHSSERESSPRGWPPPPPAISSLLQQPPPSAQ